MIESGRTMREACDAGTLFMVGTYAPPACETLAEVLKCARKKFRGSIGSKVPTYRVLDCTIGAQVLEFLGDVTL